MSNTDSGWRKRQIALEKMAENARELGLDYERNKTVMEMARKAGMVYREFEDEFANANTDAVDFKTLEAFAALVRAEEREACAKVCEQHGVHPALNVWNGGPDWYKHGKDCATAIRERGDKHDTH